MISTFVAEIRRWCRLSSVLVLSTASLAFSSIASAADLSVAARFFPKIKDVQVEAPAGKPPSAAIRGSDGKVFGYAFSTWTVSHSVGFSGRPLDIVAAVTPAGIIAGAKIVAHEEPVLVIGIPREALATYVSEFKGFNVRTNGALRPTGSNPGGPEVVAGASITSAVIRDAILRSARTVLRTRVQAAQSAGKPRLDRETLRRLSWPALVAEGAIQHRLVSRGEAAQRLGIQDSEPDKPFIDLWLTLATPPTIGESLVGQREYERILAEIGPDDDIVLIAAKGLYSYKGTEWRRSGVFDRIEIVQGQKTISFRASDHRRIDRLLAPGAPQFREVGLFRIPHGSGFDSTAPFRLDLTLGAHAGTAAPPVISLDYRIPKSFLVSTSGQNSTRIAAERALQAPSDVAATAQKTNAENAQPPLWQEIWWKRRYEIVVLAAMLICLSAVLIFQDAVAARGLLYRRLRIGFLLLTFVFLGLFAKAQLSVVNVITFVHALLSGFRWELFLFDPLVFMLWGFVAASMLFWGRGVFCGWLCPFGALQELLHQLARRLGLKQFELPFALQERLWMLKYVIFLGIIALSLHSIVAAFEFAEVEPFKTVITLKFMREWPFVAYASSLLIAGFFIERFFCRYLCPLGAAVAIPARMRMFEWLKRYRECGAECQICARSCTVQAIHPLGQINPNECIYCLQCQANYFDKDVCIHLIKRAERRRPRPPVPTAVAAANHPGASNAS